MKKLASIVPEFVNEIGAALASAGQGNFISQLESGVIERCTYDPSVDAGYIYLSRPVPSDLLPPVAETIPFLEFGFNVDIDHNGQVFGIEFLNRTDVLTKLRQDKVL